jgi:hypothetical protein
MDAFEHREPLVFAERFGIGGTGLALQHEWQQQQQRPKNTLYTRAFDKGTSPVLDPV